MKATKKYVVPFLTAAAIGAAVVMAPIASANTDPTTPYGTDTMSPAIFGYHTWFGADEDVPF